MDESRKQFEVFIEIYRDGRTLNIWDIWQKAWQTSRAAIEIELPQIRYGYAGNKEYKPEEVVAAIRAAGIKVKE